jgi:hypothetical protein
MLSVGSLADRRLEGNGEWNMGYVNVIRIAQAMYGYIETHHPGAVVAAAWPDNVNLERLDYGYVERPRRSARYRELPALTDFDVLVASWPSDGWGLRQYALRQVDLGVLRLEKRLEDQGVFSELYVKTSTALPERR